MLEAAKVLFPDHHMVLVILRVDLMIVGAIVVSDVWLLKLNHMVVMHVGSFFLAASLTVHFLFLICRLICIACGLLDRSMMRVSHSHHTLALTVVLVLVSTSKDLLFLVSLGDR